MSSLDKIIEKVPYSDGGFRRRMTAGVIVNISIGLAWFVSGNSLDVKIDDLKSILSSPLIATVILLLVYAVGGLVEVVAELFITRLTGNTAWAVISPMSMFEKRHKLIKLILRGLAYYPGIIFILYKEWGEAFIGRSNFKWKDLDKHLKPNTRDHLKSLPEIVKEGVKEPFGKYSDLPWRYFSNHGVNDDIKQLARKLENRNKDVLVIVTSLLLSALILISAQELDRSLLPSEVDKTSSVMNSVVVIQFLMLVLVVLLGSYFLLLRQSILTIIEYSALSESKAVSVEHNNTMHPTTRVATAPSVSGDG